MAVTTAKETKEAGSEKEPAILIIDPNEEHQVLSTVALGRRGFRVTIAGTAREGLRLALSQPFALIVLDLKVRDMPALEVLAVLRDRIPEVPKILVVPAGQEQSAVRALDTGASGFLVKTARYNELLPSEVEAQLRAAQARRSLTAHKKALGESEERFQKAFRASPVALSIVTRGDGRFVDANDAFLRILGSTREELVGQSAWASRLYTDPAALERAMEGVRARGSVANLEIPFRTRSGELRIGLSSLEAIEIEGEPCILTMVRDVTEDRRAERLRDAMYEISEAASSSRDLPALFQAIQEAVASLMPAENFYIALYDAASDMIEFPYFIDEKEPSPAPYKAGRGLTEFVLRSGAPLLVTPARLRELVASGQVDIVGVEGVDWLGVPLVVAGRTIGVLAVQSYAESTRYKEEDKQVLSMVSAQVALAIDRKRSDEALRRAEARFRTVFVDAPMGIGLADTDGILRETNPALQRMLGRTADELRGMPVSAITSPEDAEATRRMFDETVRGGRPGYQVEKRYVRKDGRVFWGRVTGTLLRAQGTEPAFVLAVIEDITEAKTALEVREADSRRFETLISKISDGISLTDADGRITWQSASAGRMFGFEPGEAIGRAALDFVHPDDLAEVGKGFEALMANPGKSMVAEVRIRHRDGSWRWTEVAGTNLLEDPGLRAVVYNFRDMTQRNDALEQIRFQASLLSQVRNAVLATDDAFRIIYWNDFATTMFGWRASEARGKSIGDFLISPEARAEFEQVAKGIRVTGHWEGERVMARKDGGRFPTNVAVTALRDRNDRIIGYVGVCSDIRERVKAEQELKVRARQQAAVAALGQMALAEPSLSALLTEAVAMMTQTLSVEYGSVLELLPDAAAFSLRAKSGWDLPLGARIANNPEESLAAYTLTKGEPVILGNAATETRFRVPKLFTERGLQSGITVVIPGQTGPYGVLSAQSKSPRAFSADDISFVSAIATVIASAIERNRVEKALAENERLASMGQLAAYVAHEINTPLTNISLLASNIARRETDPGILRKLGEIGEQRRKASVIITDLVDVPRQPALRRVPEDVRTVIAAAVEQVAPYRKTDVDLVVETKDRAVFANINTVQIRDVFVNLLRNALQATSHGTVTVRLSDLPGYLFVSVEDTGTGMPPEVLQQLFHPLYGAGTQADSSLLGLAVSRGIVAAHGGKIEATSQVGKGSTFTVILPRFEAH